MKVTINGFLFYRTDSWLGQKFDFSAIDMSTMEGWIMVRPHSIEVDIPDDFNPIPGQLAALEKEKAKVRADFNQRIAELNDKIGKLQALTFDEVKP